MSELKPCPYCGSDDINIQTGRDNYFAWAECKKCGSSNIATLTHEQIQNENRVALLNTLSRVVIEIPPIRANKRRAAKRFCYELWKEVKLLDKIRSQ